jgi:hypothetical protein
MGSSNKELFSSHKCFSDTDELAGFSLIDTRPTDFRKTTESISRNKGRCYIHILPDYPLCEEIASKNPNGFVLYGRPKFCEKIDEEVYKYVIPSCRGCDNILNCGFHKQKERGLGRDIYTVPQNLRLAMEWFGSKTIVIDDYPLSDIIFEYEDVTFTDISRLKDYLKDRGPKLFRLLKKIQPDLFQDIGKEIHKFIKKNRKELEKEYKSLDWEEAKQHRAMTKIISLMLEAKKLWVFGIINESGTPLIRICGKMFTKRDFNKVRIEYITATPQNHEKDLLKQISSLPIVELTDEPQARKNTTVIQIKDALYPTTTIKSKYNTKFKRINKSIDDFISKPARALGLEVVLFLTDSCKKVIQPCYKNLKLNSRRFKNSSTTVTNPNIAYEGLIPILLHGKGSIGTNDLIDISIGIISGISFLPLPFFIRPPYIEDFERLRFIIEEKISSDRALLSEWENIRRVYKNKSKDLLKSNLYHVLYDSIEQYGVNTREIVENRIKQAIARIARGKDEPKLIIIISNLELTDREDGFIPEVGVHVKRIESGKLLEELKAWFKPLLEKAVIEKERMHLNKLTRKRAEKLAEKYGCFSWGWYYKRLKFPKGVEEGFNMLWNAYTKLYFEVYPDALYPEYFEDEDELQIRYNFLRKRLEIKKKQ